MISVVVNTCALGARSQRLLSSTGIEYGKRAALLKECILPNLTARTIDQIVVSGEYEAGDGYEYVHSASEAFDATDALKQRSDGFAASTGDLILFQHDDHLAATGFFHALGRYAADDSWDVLVPARQVSDRGAVLTLNNGKPDGYVMGHACVMRRTMVEKVPWADVEKVFSWDVSHTKLLLSRGARIRWVGDLVMWDLEERAPGYGW
jgi:hypothetical protein